MRVLSWNVNGLLSTLKNGFEQVIRETKPDVICLQETKVTKEIKGLKLDDYYKYFNFSKIAGYAGVAIFSKQKAENIFLGIEKENEDGELEDGNDHNIQGCQYGWIPFKKMIGNWSIIKQLIKDADDDDK